MSIITKHVQKWMREPFGWHNGSDCMLSIADYLVDATGIDCATRYRGRYRSARECAKLSGYLRDPVKPFADCVAEIPLAETDAPRRGDVGVIDTGAGVVGAICLGDQWALRGEAGVVFGRPLRVLAAWSVPCRP